MSQFKKQPESFSKRTATLYSNRPEAIQAESLYSDHYEKVRAFLISRCQSSDLIEEVLQDLYLKLMVIDDLSQIQNPASYLVRMAHNLLIDALRRQSREDRRSSQEDSETLSLADPAPLPFDTILSLQQLQSCEQALSELPLEYKEILLLNRLEGYTHSQIAKKYGRSTSWVEKTIVRTLAHCRRKLELFERD